MVYRGSSRALERQISSLYYERLLSSKDKAGMQAETGASHPVSDPTARDFGRDPVLLEFLGLPETGRLLEAEHAGLKLGNVLQLPLQ